MKILAAVLLGASLAAPLQAQTVDDGIMIARHSLFTGAVYSHERWDQYWEGALKRVNGNIGTITTQSSNWFANYGVTDRLNVMATIPYIWTRPSQGVLTGMSGFQDVTLAGKFRMLETRASTHGLLRVFAVASAGLPLTNYSPDLQPLSIGFASKRVSGRLTLNYQSNPGWFLNGSTSYTWRRHVTLDRPYYFTDGQLFLTDEVTMPGVVDYVASAGYMRGGLMTAFSFSQQRTQGGGDIRRQDIPFVSNRMDFSKVGGMVMYPVPKLHYLALQLAYAYTIDGRNVGQATTFTTSVLYRGRLDGRPTQ